MGNLFSNAPPETKYFPDFCEKLPALTDQTIAITGCTSGTGLIAAQTSAQKGAAYVIMLNRPSERAQKAEAAVQEVAAEGTIVESYPCDLQDMASVQACIAQIKKKHQAIDVLCNNAGVMALDDYATKDGYDVQMQTNHLCHFLLTKELFPLLERAAELRGSARIVHHSSLARNGGPLKAEYFGKNGGNLGGNSNGIFMNGARWERYHQTKLANAIFTYALWEKLTAAKSKVIAAVAAPGLSNTNLQKTTAKTGGMDGAMWIMKLSQSAEDGTMPLLAAMLDPSTENGDFWEPSHMAFYGPPKKVPHDKNTKDAEQGKMLWDESEKACGKFDI